MSECFVISPFGEPFDEYYREIYQPAIARAGLQALRADEIFTPGVFMRDVVEKISSSSVVLAELTGRNANVFYELGLAHAFGKPVVLLAQQPDDVPADLRAIRWIRYDRIRPRWAVQLAEDIAAALEAALKDDVPIGFEAPATRILGERLLSVSGTQKALLDHLRRTGQKERLSSLARRFQKGESEMYYRLETLRLLGFVRMTADTPEPEYGLTPELQRIWLGAAPA